jgi:hypothetical protein
MVFGLWSLVVGLWKAIFSLQSSVVSPSLALGQRGKTLTTED